MKPSLSLILSTALFSGLAVAQKTTGPTTTGTGTTTPTPTTGIPRNTNPIPNTNTTNTQPTMGPQRPVFISGRVVLDDGTPPPELVRIEKVCGGNPRPQGYTDHKGHFSFDLDSGIGVMPDASDAAYNPSGTPNMSANRTSSMGGVGGQRNYMGCEVRAVLPGFRSDAVSLAMHESFDNPNIGTIVLHRIGNVEGTTISMTSLNAPRDAQKALEKGRDAMKKEKTEEAEKDFRKAVDLYPKYAVAWYELGRVQEHHNQGAEAAKSYQLSIDADRKYVSPYISLAFLSVKANDWPKALEITDKAIKLNPGDFPEAYFYNSIANLNLHNIEPAEKSAREAMKLDQQHRFQKIDELLGTILAQKGDYAEAATLLRSYLKKNPNAPDLKQVQVQLEELDKLAQAPAEQKR